MAATVVGGGMVIDAVDQTDTPIATVSRKDVFRVHANFRVAHVLVFNSKGELLIQRLALTRARNPGFWGSSVAAYMFSHEDYIDAARRRIAEELGVYGADLLFGGKTYMNDEGCTKFIGIFTTVNEGPFQFDQQHIDQLEFLPVETIRARMNNGTIPFTPTFINVFNFYESSHPEQ